MQLSRARASRQAEKCNSIRRISKSCIGGAKYAAKEYLPPPSKMSGVTFHFVITPNKSIFENAKEKYPCNNCYFSLQQFLAWLSDTRPRKRRIGKYILTVFWHHKISPIWLKHSSSRCAVDSNIEYLNLLQNFLCCKENKPWGAWVLPLLLFSTLLLLISLPPYLSSSVNKVKPYLFVSKLKVTKYP